MSGRVATTIEGILIKKCLLMGKKKNNNGTYIISDFFSHILVLAYKIQYYYSVSASMS